MAESKITKNEYRKLLWSNSHAGYWGTDNIVLSSSDYSVLEVVFAPTNNGSAPRVHQRFSKGKDIGLFYASASSIATDCFIMTRYLQRTNDTTFKPALSYIVRWSHSGADEPQNYFVIPIEIYGIKY